LIRAGEVIAFPTDTLYGLGADATNEAAVARVFSIKGRAETKPLLVLVRDLTAAQRFGRIEGAALELAQRHWPGPLTLVVERAEDSHLARGLNPLGSTIAIRVPARAMTHALLVAVDRPITAPSANRSGEPPAQSAAAALAGLGQAIALVLDGGPSAQRASTILDCSAARLRLIREGAIPRATLERTIGPLDG
jgi:L-threonylcarbamoyladenylate synthase